MPKKYHIPLKDAPPRFHPIGKYATVEFRENCAGSCRECVKKKCVYNIFKDNYQHMSTTDEPLYLYTCQSCFRCVQECTRGIFSRVINPEYRSLGDDYWRADMLHQTWYQAHTGKIPVSGSGYRGPFVAEGFDTMWTDMSEIVRPTRDGIHGREYINTSIELSRKSTHLSFDKDGTIADELSGIFEVPIPVLFRQPRLGILSESILLSAAKAAHVLGGLLFIQPDAYTDAFHPYADNLVPCLSRKNYGGFHHLIQKSPMVELTDEPGIQEVISRLRGIKPGIFISVSMPLNKNAANRAVTVAQTDVDTLHFYSNSHGKSLDADTPKFLGDMIREVHLNLVKHALRERINLLFSGGIAMAEHMAKAIICGADGVTISNSLLIALECRLCYRCERGESCPAKLDEIEVEWGCQRIVNLMGAWRNQLLEVMGAMGIREARRLRGEVGRAMWFEDLEKENFGPIFGEKKLVGLG